MTAKTQRGSAFSRPAAQAGTARRGLPGRLQPPLIASCGDIRTEYVHACLYSLSYIGYMNSYKRPHVRRVIQLVEDGSTMRIIAITGPRQTGKTTIALQAQSLLIRSGLECWYFALDDPARSRFRAPGLRGAMDDVPVDTTLDGRWLVQLWESARRAALQFKRGLVLCLDEIQLVPGWSAILKGLWDADRRVGCPLRVIILGSAPQRIFAGQSESLVGRFEPLRVSHWSLREMAEAFDLTVDECVFFGGYPGAQSVGSPAEQLANWKGHIMGAIVAPTINRDIIGLTPVAKPAVMRQLMELVPHYSGQIVSYNKLLGQLDNVGNATTLKRYLDLLSDAGLVTALPRYAPAPHVGRKSPPKLNVLNTALMTVPSGYTFEEARADRSYWGRIVESAVGAHLYNSRGISTRLSFWRDKESNEVNFVIARGPHLLGVEVKSGRLRLLSRSGLKAFAKRFPNAKTTVVGTGGIPLNEFLSRSADEWLDEN